MVTIIYTRMKQCLDIFRKARPSIATTCIEKLRTYARITAYALAHTIDVGPYPLTEISNIIHKRNTGSQHGISSIFGHLC